MNALLCDDFEELANPPRSKPVRAAARFERTSLQRYHAQSRFRRRPGRGATSGLHRRRAAGGGRWVAGDG